MDTKTTKNKWTKRTDLLIKLADIQEQDEKGNVFLNTKERYLSLTLDNGKIRITLNTKFQGKDIENPDFLIRKNEGIIVRIKNKDDYPIYHIEEKEKGSVEHIEIVNLLVKEFHATETDLLKKDFSAVKSLGLED